MALSALEDESQSQPPCREYIEALLSALGYDAIEDWTRLTDEELVSFITCPVRLNDQITHDRALSRIRKARQRLKNWQGKEGNPILIEHRNFFEHAADSKPGNPKGKHYSEYKLPFGELIRDVIEKCPIGTRDDRLKKAVKGHVIEYLKRFDGESRRDKKKRQHSPESDLKRVNSVALAAIRREESRVGHQSTINLLRSSFSPELVEYLREAFFDNPNQNNDLIENPCETNVPSILEPDGAEFCHVSEEEDMAKLSPEPPEFAEETGAVIPPCDLTPNEESQGGIAPLLALDSAHTPAFDNLAEAILAEEGDEFRAFSAFLSVGASIDQALLKNDQTKEIQERHISVEEFARSLPKTIAFAEEKGRSLIARVRGPVLQIDDCDSNTASLLHPFAFLTVETSERNYQCWLAFRDEEDKEEAGERLFRGLRELLPTKANPGAGGAMRWPGSINFKPERNGWRVRVHSADLGRFVTPSELDDAGLLADLRPEPERRTIPDSLRGDWWPDWERCLADKLEEAKEKKLDRESHRSEADAAFVYLCLRYGHSEESIQAKLLEVSPRAQESGEKYAERTVTKVSKWMSGANQMRRISSGNRADSRDSTRALVLDPKIE
jgi:hypothetical protein